MKVLIVGSGGREHALAWKAAQSPRLTRLYVAPGNAGTQTYNCNIAMTDHNAIATFACNEQIDLVIIGPEAPLAVGLADALRAAGLKVFGPSQAAAEIESSKAFAKAFMARHHIPSARFATFTQFEDALNYMKGLGYPFVIKASGLAAGKGVILPESAEEAEAALRSIMLDREFGTAGEEVILEERLTGEEVSLLAFSDGRTVKPMPPAQDHKRLLDHDLGPNTGGMGAYAPAPVCPPAMAAELARLTLQPAIDGLHEEGRPFVGVLYAGLMLTPDGPRVLEYNCRFGDPETQVILPLLDTDLLTIAEACADGAVGAGWLADVDVRWKPGAAACVVAASEGYPGHSPLGRTITGLDTAFTQATIFQAGTKCVEDKPVTAGGRVLAATGWDTTIAGALDRAYTALRAVDFAGKQARSDIGWRALKAEASTYRSAGVDIDAGNRAVELMRAAVQATYGPEVLAGLGAFGGLYSADALKNLAEPVLVASTDGVGTKVKLAAQCGRYESIGHDIVNHCLNDILVQGARPLFFLDYIASSRLEPEMVAAVVTGIAGACRAAGCAVLGGETAEMPGVYAAGTFDVAGTIVGVLDRAHMLPHTDLQAGDVLLGLRSSGPHTNGYSLIRKLFAEASLDEVLPELGLSLAEALLAPHRSYLPLLLPEIQKPDSRIKALAHLTGGGFIENIPRVLPPDLKAVIHIDRWPSPPIFNLIQQRGNIARDEMYRVFNIGIGLVSVVAAENASSLKAGLPETTSLISYLTTRERRVELQ